jgi:hypothetical protein
LCLPAPLPQLATERGRQSKHPPSPPPQDARPARAHTLPPTDMGVTVSTWPTCHPHHPASSRVRGGRRIPWGLVGPRLLTGQIRGARAPDRAPPPPTVRPPGRLPPLRRGPRARPGPPPGGWRVFALARYLHRIWAGEIRILGGSRGEKTVVPLRVVRSGLLFPSRGEKRETVIGVAVEDGGPPATVGDC